MDASPVTVGKQRLELLHLLAVRALLRGGLQDEAEVLAQAARDGVVQREVEHRVRRFARDQRTAECALRGRGQVHSAGAESCCNAPWVACASAEDVAPGLPACAWPTAAAASSK